MSHARPVPGSTPPPSESAGTPPADGGRAARHARHGRRSPAGSHRATHPAGVAAAADADPIATTRDLVKAYGKGDTEVRALDGLSATFGRGQFSAIMGPSGSGKSTLMHCLAGLDQPTSGSVIVDGHEVSAMSERKLTKLRREKIGFVFQAFNLVPTLTAAENITLPLDIAHLKVDQAWFEQVVATVGLGDRLTHRPAQLSGGQQQRVACARALMSKPSVVFADEPTGNLDSKASREVLGFLRRSVDDLGQSIIIVTHDPVAASYADRVLFLADGRLVGEVTEPTEATILDALRAASKDA